MSAAPGAPNARVVDPRHRSIRGLCAFVLVFAIAAAYFLLLRSHDLTVIDGPVRAFDIYRNPALEFHSSSHMLYPVYVLAWTRALIKLGFDLADPKQFIRAVQAMNALFAAGACAVLFSLVRSLTNSWKLGVAAAMSWATSHAVLLHGTNAAEPVTGLFLSVCALAVTLAAVRLENKTLMFGAGALLALTMASYQSMVFAGLACGLIALFWPEEGGRRRVRWSRAVFLVTGFVLSLGLIYAVCYRLQGIHSLSQGIAAFRNVPARNVYGGLSLAKIVNLPVGLANAVVISIPGDYIGLRWLVRTQRLWLLLTSLAVVVVVAIITWASLRKPNASKPAWMTSFVFACWSSLALCLGLQIYWQPLYDKMWLLPLWLFSLLLFTMSAFVQPPSASWKRCLAAMAVIGIAINLSSAVRSAHGPWPNFDEAQRVRSIVGPRDLVVSDWSSVSLLYARIWAGDERSFDFTTHSCGSAPADPQELSHRISQTLEGGGNVYFLGELDLPRWAWDSFLGQHCGVPYGTLDVYRARSQTVATLRSDGGNITLRRFDPLAVAASLR